MDNPGRQTEDEEERPKGSSSTGNDQQQDEDSNHCYGFYKASGSIEDRLNRHFRDDFTKVCTRARWRFLPLKFVISLMKIIFVTWQLVLFGSDHADFAGFLDKNNIALKNVLLKNWDAGFETMPYPPNNGQYAVYTIKDMKEHIKHAAHQVYSLPTSSVGTYFMKNDTEAVQLCLRYFRHGVYNQTTKKITVDNVINDNNCTHIGSDLKAEYNINNALEILMGNVDGTLVRLLSARLKFTVESIYLRPSGVQCFDIDGQILFDNEEINGQMIVTLATRVEEFACEGTTVTHAGDEDLVIYVMVALLSVSSIILSAHSFVTSCCLAYDVFQSRKIPHLSIKGAWQILRVNDAFTIFVDIIVLVGTILKAYIDNKDTIMATGRETMYDACEILLGLGCLFSWIGILHFLNFFSSFYLLFAVIEYSMVTVVQFLLCVVVIYLGFTFCGWLVLGPYHLKFATFGSTVQTLLALVNGDEVYVTYTAVGNEQTTARYFNTAFISIFVFLFTIIALNIFISIFIAMYEEIEKKKNIGKEREKGSSDTFNGLSEIQKLLNRYQLEHFGELKEEKRKKDTTDL